MLYQSSVSIYSIGGITLSKEDVPLGPQKVGWSTMMSSPCAYSVMRRRMSGKSVSPWLKSPRRKQGSSLIQLTCSQWAISFAISARRLRVAIYGQDPKLISSRLYLGCYCFAWKNLLFLQQSEGTGYDDGDSSWQPSAISLISWRVRNSEARIGLQEISSSTSGPSGFLQAHYSFAGISEDSLSLGISPLQGSSPGYIPGVDLPQGNAAILLFL